MLLVAVVDNARLHVELLNHAYDTSEPLTLNHWHHIAIAHQLADSEAIKIMINGSLIVVRISTRISSQSRRKQPNTISSGGDFFVGQTIRPKNSTSLRSTGDFEFDGPRAFLGEIAFLHFWQRVLTDRELHQLATDCHAQQRVCGDAVTWMDLVNDIKAGIQIHWPSGISSLLGNATSSCASADVQHGLSLANCPTEHWLHESCDTHCRKLEGNRFFRSTSTGTR